MAREDGIHKIEFHVAGICFDLTDDENPRCLIAKRTDARKLFPGLWECGGGQVQEGESLPKALMRQIKEEFGITAEVLFPYSDYFIEQAGGIAGMKFVCSVSAESKITLDPKEHTEYAWVQETDLDQYNFIPGVKEDIEESLNILAEC